MIKILKKNFEEKHLKDTRIFLKKKTKKRRKNHKKDIKVLLKNKKKKGVSIIRIVNRSYLNIEEIIISHIKNKYSVA